MKLHKELKKLEETLIEYHSIDIKRNQIPVNRSRF